MTDPLATYLDDHLAGSRFAIELLASIRDRFSGQPLGSFADALLGEIRDDQRDLIHIIDRVGKGGMDLKSAVGWVAEKLSRVKLQDDGGAGLGTFESLETLSLGIVGRAALWNPLATIRDQDERVGHEDFNQLRDRALNQYDRVEAQRIQLARTVFAPVV